MNCKIENRFTKILKLDENGLKNGKKIKRNKSN